MFGSRDFPTLKLISYFKVNFCSEFAMRSATEKAEQQINSMQFSTLKSGNLKNQTFAHSRILSI